MRRLAQFALGVALGAAVWSPGAKADDTHVGWIEGIDGKCDGKWRAKDGGEVKRLDAAKDHFRFLYPGESVRCDGMGSMSLQVLDNRPKKVLKEDGWCTVYDEAAVCEKEKMPGAKAAVSGVMDRALREFGRPAGRQRGFRSAIFSPAPESSVRASELVLRWNEIPGATRIALQLTDKYHSVLWEQVDVDAGSRELVAGAMRTALVAYRDKGGAGPFSLKLTNEGTAQPLVRFSVLSGDEEHALDGELAKCERNKGLRHLVCRTAAFSRREMWNNAAEEYEAALKLAPESRDLTLAALAAETSIGNAKRAGQLRAMLAPGTSLPE